MYRTTRVDGERIWRASQTLRTPEGKSHKIRGEGATADIAKERLEANVLRWKIRHGLAVAPEATDLTPTEAPRAEVVVLTVHGWLNQWLDQHSDDDMSPGTRYGHERSIRNHIAPALGHVALSELTTADIRTFVSTTLPGKRHPRDDSKPLLGASAIRRIYFVLNSALNEAVKQELIASNPGNRMDRPRRTRRASEQVEERTGDAMVILRNLEGKPDYFRWMLAFYGLRQSEVLGLTDDCLLNLQDPQRATLDVKQQLARRYKRHGCGHADLQGKHPCGKTVGRLCPQAQGQEGLYLKEPKTLAGIRRIPLSGRLLTAARDHLRKQRALRLTDGFTPVAGLETLLFTSPTGEPRRQQVDGRAWKQLLEELEIPTMRGHLARHVSVSIMAESGAMPSTIALVVGHSDIASQAVYTHLNADVMRSPLQALETVLHGGTGNAPETHVQPDLDALRQENAQLLAENRDLRLQIEALRGAAS